MRNKKFWVVILAKMLIFGLTFFGCDNGSTTDNGDVPNTSGRLTISGLSDYNGKYAIAYHMDGQPYLIGAASLSTSTSGKGGRISNGSVALKMWSADVTTQALSSYTGNDQNVEIAIMIFTSESVSEGEGDSPIAQGKATVSFTNGVGSGTFTEPGGSLTITGLGAYNGKFAVAYRGIDNGYTPPYLVGADTLTTSTSGNATRISNASATLKIWAMDASGHLTNYTGNDQNVEIPIMIYDIMPVGPSVQPIAQGKVTVSFTNGVGSGTFTEAGGTPDGGDTSSGLTLSGLGAYNGKYVIAERPSNPPMTAAATFDITTETKTGGVVVNGSVTLSVWEKNQSNTYVPFTRSINNLEFTVAIYNAPDDTSPIATGTITVTFTNGAAGGTVQNIQPVEDGGGPGGNVPNPLWGQWDNSSGSSIDFANDSSFKSYNNGIQFSQGTYSINNENSTITLTFTLVSGSMAGLGNNTLYDKQGLITALMSNEEYPLTEQEAQEEADETFSPQVISYSISGNTLNLGSFGTFTRR